MICLFLGKGNFRNKFTSPSNDKSDLVLKAITDKHAQVTSVPVAITSVHQIVWEKTLKNCYLNLMRSANFRCTSIAIPTQHNIHVRDSYYVFCDTS